jgi:hypothetical protein
LIVDEQKGLVSVSALFVHDGTRRNAPSNAPPGMLQNLVTAETIGIRGGLIHEVEVFPFVTLPYGVGDGWTPGLGRQAKQRKNEAGLKLVGQNPQSNIYGTERALKSSLLQIGRMKCPRFKPRQGSSC